MIKWEKGEIIDKQKIDRLRFSILKYATRVSTRCTPFGLLVCCNSGTFDTKTNIQLKEIIGVFFNLEREQKLTVSVEDLLASFIHMNINRCFRSKQCLYEMTIYDFLYRKINLTL